VAGLDSETDFLKMEAEGIIRRYSSPEFAVPEVQFLGHHVTAEGILPLPEKVAAIQAHPKPVTVKQLQAFPRMVNFYRRFVRKFCGHALMDLLNCEQIRLAMRG
jgi:hypothetical protein